MAIVYRSQKGLALSVEEMDGNFRDLDKRLKEVEEVPSAAEGIKKIVVEGDVMSVIGSHGTDFGDFKLPVYIPQIKGLWKKGETYHFCDWVQYKNGLYGCKTAHKAEEFLEENWVLIYIGE